MSQQEFKKHFRSGKVEDNRLPLIRNLVRYCLSGDNTGEHRDYAVSVDVVSGIIRLMLQPQDSQERAYITIKATIDAEVQMHDQDNLIHAVAYDFSDIKPIEARMHRHGDSLAFDLDFNNEKLSEEELADPLLLEMLETALTEGYLFSEEDLVTGDLKLTYDFSLPKSQSAYES